MNGSIEPEYDFPARFTNDRCAPPFRPFTLAALTPESRQSASQGPRHQRTSHPNHKLTNLSWMLTV